MAGLFDLDGHLAFYRSYHVNKVNVAIHLACIPVILLTAITFSTPKTFGSNPFVNIGSIVAWTYGTYYVLLDWKCGVPAFALLTTYAYNVDKYYLGLSTADQAGFIKGAVAIHVLAWLAQFYGHGVHEKRAPALLDNLLQALVLAPYFVVFEVAFYLGLRLDLKKKMDDRAGKLIAEFRKSA